MLTQKSKVTSKFRVLVIIPALVLFVACGSKSNPSQSDTANGDTITAKGSQAKTDTVSVQDPVTGKWEKKGTTKYDTVSVQDPATGKWEKRVITKTTLASTHDSVSGNKEQNEANKTDTVLIQDPVTGKWTQKVNSKK